MKVPNLSYLHTTTHRLFASHLLASPSPLKPFINLNSSISFLQAPKSSVRLFYARMTSRNPPFSPSPVQVRDSIELTPIEKRIFERLVDVVNHFELQTQLRVAGGWVRDKLLGKDCYDIDIALDGMTGREFCEKINEYMLSSGEEAQGIGVIQCNPEQSKHLETARMRLFDVWIDFVNLRCESYSESSRIPEVKFGTPAEDAYRRDLTINSLFYNIIEREVEDLTGRGKSDLRAGKIVTPLPPRQTFLDDPLRVLRAIRFGTRRKYYSFQFSSFQACYKDLCL